MRKVQYTVEELTCPECGFVAVNANGLRGHRQFKHGVRPSGAQLPLQKQDLLVSESKLQQLLDERLGVLSEQLDELAGVVGELQQGFPALLKQVNQRTSISEFPIPEQAAYLAETLRQLSAESAAVLLVNAGKADMLQAATDKEVQAVEEQQAKELEEPGVSKLMAVLDEIKPKKTREEREEEAMIVGRTSKPGYKYLKAVNISILEDA